MPARISLCTTDLQRFVTVQWVCPAGTNKAYFPLMLLQGLPPITRWQRPFILRPDSCQTAHLAQSGLDCRRSITTNAKLPCMAPNNLTLQPAPAVAERALYFVMADSQVLARQLASKHAEHTLAVAQWAHAVTARVSTPLPSHSPSKQGSAHQAVKFPALSMGSKPLLTVSQRSQR